MIKDVHINKSKPPSQGDGIPCRDGTFAYSIREHRYFGGSVVA